MATAPQIHLLSEQQYLADELQSEVKHEYIDGQVYAMAGAHANHNRLSATLVRKIGNHLEGKTCQPYASDMKVKIGSKYFYPDVMVDCSDNTDYFTESPKLIIEILSKSTRRTDKTIKLMAYTQIPTLEEYVLIDQDIVEIEILRKNQHWLPQSYYLGDKVTFMSIGLTLSVEDIYQRVQNTDMLEWLNQAH
ncbi:MAG: Uma2 family endonuclease [Moraxellaceae bacterium]|nr:Uma2 family endonuclease [Moraxellaceae bacterium]MCP5177127.1 Uma2 family endonuclease [Moraxellaceae bacterium]